MTNTPDRTALPEPDAEIEVLTHGDHREINVDGWSDALPDGVYKVYTERHVQELLSETRRKYQAEAERWKAEAAWAEKWRGMALTHVKVDHCVATALRREGANAEREACAQACDARANELLSRPPRRQHHHGAGLGASLCADDIRARGAA